MRRIIMTSAALALMLIVPGIASAQSQSRPGLSDMSEEEREAFRSEVRTYLLEHPEVLMEAIQVLEQRRDAEASARDTSMVAEHREKLLNDPNSWVGGNPDGDVTLVEFLDYRCGYCKKAHPELKELLQLDPNIRLVVKEFPILGPDSVAAGRVATAALDLDRSKYEALHNSLMEYGGQLNEATAYQLASHVGYDIAALKERAASAEIEARLADTYSLARGLGLEGTPSFVLGNEIIRGYLPVEQMLAAVARAREATN